MAASAIAHIGARATTESATAGAAQSLKTGNNFTAQYLYDQFIGDGARAAESTKMNIVRNMATALPDTEFKKVVKEFVALAKEKGEAAHKTAQNQQNVMRLAFGALTKARDELDKLGYDNTTGFHVMRVIAKKALEAKKIDWQGRRMLSDAEKSAKETSEAMQKATADAMRDTPQNINESLPDYLARVQGVIEEKLANNKADAQAQAVSKIVDKISTMCDEDLSVFEAVFAEMKARIDNAYAELAEAEETADATADATETETAE